MTYVCPGGEQVVVSSAQNEAISACLGDSQDGAQCEVVGGGSGFGVDTCDNDDDCEAGEECTDTGYGKHCMPDSGVDGCETDDDCEYGLECCDLTYMKVCAPDCSAFGL